MTMPNSQPDLFYHRGNTLRIQGHFDAAESDFRVVLEYDPKHRDAALSLAFMLREQGRIEAAADVVVALWQARRNEREITLAVLEFLRECAAYTQARETAHHAATTWPDDAHLNALAGEILLALGDFTAAHVMLQRALELDPAQGAAWLRLVQCQRYTRGDNFDLQRMRLAVADDRLDRMPRICAGFALGKALDDLGEYAEAAAVLRSANAVAAEEARWDAEAWQRFIDAQIIAPPLPQIDIDPGFTPIFIVGLPRAGTTLLANRLSRHGDVRDRGELNWIAAMHEHLQARRQLHDPQALSVVARLIAAQMRRDDAPSRYIIDKNPLNFRYLNFVQALFPQAHIIHCMRSERDCALSLWQQHFAHPDTAFSYRFETIAYFIQGYRRLMQHWGASLRLPYQELRYEMLVADEGGAERQLAQFLQLPETQTNIVAPAHVIITASVWQARQPTYQRSVRRWRNYANYLPELEQLFSE